MKKLSLFSLFGLMAFVTMPIYAEENDVYADENYAVVTKNVDTEEIGNKVEENDVVLAVEEEPIIEWSTDLDVSQVNINIKDIEGSKNNQPKINLIRKRIILW